MGHTAGTWAGTVETLLRGQPGCEFTEQAGAKSRRDLPTEQRCSMAELTGRTTNIRVRREHLIDAALQRARHHLKEAT